jgi:ketosteroid isomerase-like protein
MRGRKVISPVKLSLSILAVAGGLAWPATAQQRPSPSPTSAQMPPQPTEQDNFRVLASNLNAQRSEYYRKGDLNGLTSLYTPDATYIQLLPRLSVMQGRAEIQQHMRDLMSAKASDLALTVTRAEMTGKDAMMAGGDYSVSVQGGKKIYGHFFQVLRQDSGTWKIAMHAFARPEPVTAIEVSQYHTGG